MVTKEEVDEAREAAQVAHTKLGLAEDLYKKASECYYTKSKKFRQLDYELAKIDGRLKVLPSSGVRRSKEIKPAELTLDQIKAIMEKLGVNLSIAEAMEAEELMEVEEIAEMEVEDET